MGKSQLCIVCSEHIGLRGWGNHVNMHKRNLGENIYVEVRNRLGMSANKQRVKKPSKESLKLKSRILMNHKLGEYLG